MNDMDEKFEWIVLRAYEMQAEREFAEIKAIDAVFWQLVERIVNVGNEVAAWKEITQ